MHRRITTALLIVSAAALRAGSRVMADTTVVATVTVDRSPADPGATSSPETLTTYFQGAKSRIDLPDGTVLLFNTDRDKIYQVDPNEKTFREGSIMAPHSMSSNPVDQRLLDVPADFVKDDRPVELPPLMRSWLDRIHQYRHPDLLSLGHF
jgi:hypothetical protein